MITCTVCLAENDEFAITCSKCKAFLQDRVPNLDLFETGWMVLESPTKAFRRITLAEHKNYVYFLFTLFGVGLSFTGFWFFRLGNRFVTLMDLIPAAVGVGIVLGSILALLLTGVYFGFARMLGGATNFRTSFGLLGYSFTPIALSLLLVLPIELLTFGMYLFTWNPDPYAMKPLSYVVLIGLDGIVAAWSIWLAIVGTRIGHQLVLWRASVVVLGTFALALAGAGLLASFLFIPMPV
jgi:hypothetical protein